MSRFTLWRAALAAVALALAGTAAAEDAAGSFCEPPGSELLTDNAGDVVVLVNSPAGGLPVAALDLTTLKVAESASADGATLLVFTLKVTDLARPVPSAVWVVSFENAARQIMAVRMVTDSSGAATFDSYAAGADNDGNTDGQFPDGAVTPAQPESNFAADGTITIVVKADDVHVKPGDKIKRFAALASPIAGTADAPTATTGGDEMPDELARRGEVTTGECGGNAKSLVEQMGGALNPALLLPLLMLAGLRRRTR